MSTEYVTPQIRTVLKTYQCSATKSLQGPGLSLVNQHKKELASSETTDDPIVPCQPPELPQPILSVADTEHGILYETLLEGKPIACFLIGGEMRLCVPQILNTILTFYQLEQIYKYCDDLQISCSQCSPEQLNEFKAAKILPENISSSGLITRTNAERLCSALLHRTDVKRIMKGSISFKVYHKCFGKCEGICTPDLFSYKEPSCIECIICHGMFSPQKFVCHAHYNRETQICHWGFDSSNWRAYLHVSLNEENIEKYTKMLDELRDREKHVIIGCNNVKRKAVIEETHNHFPCKTEQSDIPTKKPKRVDEAFLLDYAQYQQAFIYAQYRQQQMSAFRPWAQTAPKHIPHLPYNTGMNYLSQEPPILQNPERVIRISECERFERSYQPNVALLPRKLSSSVVKERDKDRGRIIPTDIQIKQERPSTPTPPAIINSPELRVASPVVVTAPFSPEASRGSNEITSSTSPILTTETENSVTNCERGVPIENNIHTQLNANHSTIILKNGTSTSIVGNSEFDLSTDTDDDSFTGEPDSSNSNVPFEIANDILKNSRPEEREKILHIIKMLVHENIQLRQYCVENQNLQDELRRKDDYISELQKQIYEFKCHHPSTPRISSVEPTIKIKSEKNIESPSNNINSERNSPIKLNAQNYHTCHRPNEKTEVIMKPLKKSSRRSPEDTVAVIQLTPKREPPNVLCDVEVSNDCLLDNGIDENKLIKCSIDNGITRICNINNNNDIENHEISIKSNTDSG